MAPSRARMAWVVALLAVVAGVAMHRASAAVGVRLPVIPWFSLAHGGYIDLITRQPVTTSFTLSQQGAVVPTGSSAFTVQNGLWNPAPRPTSLNFFPITLPSLAFWEKCFKETSLMSALSTGCNYADTYTTCQTLANMGYLPKGVQSFEATKLTGAFNLPIGCTSASLGVSHDHLLRITFNSPQVPILAVITKDPWGAMVNYFGTGTNQGRLYHRLTKKIEFCYPPTVSDISVSKTAIYSAGMQPGTTSWGFSKSVALPAPYTNGRAAMFNGDSVDATWTLAAQKLGADVTYQGVVTGTITINNPTPAVITVNSIIDQVTNGPAATVTCPVGTPFTVPACSFATCQYTAYYPSAPPPGTYSAAAQVQFQVQGSMGYPSMVQGASVFNVGTVGSAPLATTAGQIPAGAAMVTDAQSPAQSYMFSGPGVQTFESSLTCGGAASSGAVSNTAVMTAATGQQITQSATIQKQCYDLQVTVATKAAPFVGRWGWSVNKIANPGKVNLRPDARAFEGAAASSFGEDYASTTTGDVVYSVTYTRNPPAGFVSGTPAFETTGEVIVQNPAPIAARLQSVLVSISNAAGGKPYTTEAVCPILNLGSGQRVTCMWRATPTFSPVGQQVRGIARYINLRNGEPRGGTTDFVSVPVTIGGAAAGGAAAFGKNSTGRSLLQTWSNTKTTAMPTLPELEVQPAVATTLYAADGTAMVVPNSVANGTGVIVSGDGIAAGGVPVLAMAQGTPVKLPSPLANGFVNEAGPADGVDSALGMLSGLQDECIDIADTFLTGDNSTVEGKLVTGTMPSGRICSTTTFTYTIRYGPYSDCAPRKSINAATFQTVDTQTRGSSQSDIAIAVEGCANPAALKIAATKANARANGGYSWTVSKRADRQELAVGQDATATVTYTVDYKRIGAKAGAALTSDVTVSNPSAYPVNIDSATYTATTMCGDNAKTTSGPISCDGVQVPGNGELQCHLTANVPCAGHGAYTVVLTATNGFTVTSAPQPFTFTSAQVAAASVGDCATVKDTFTLGEGNVGGAVVSGTRPNGKLCGSKTFTYTVKFGPFSECSTFKAINTAILSSNGTTKSVSATTTTPVFVVGCDLYTAEKTQTSDCVQPPKWWPACKDDDAKCAMGWKLLPGSRGKSTLFFPKANQRTDRSYTNMLAATYDSPDATPAKKAYLLAAQEFVAAQLNFLSGARLPNLELQETYDALSSFLSNSNENSPLPADQVAAIRLQTDLLAKYNNGTLPAKYKAPAVCA